MTKAEVSKQFPSILGAWRALPENQSTDEQKLDFSDFYSWLKVHYPEATKFRSTMGPMEDLERWFDVATRQSWRN